MITITETPNLPEATEAVEAKVASQEKDPETMFRAIATRQWKTFVRLTVAEINRQYSDGNLSHSQQSALYHIVGVPAKEKTVEVTAEFTHSHRLKVKSGETEKQFLERVRRDPVAYMFYEGNRVKTTLVGVTDWPEEVKAPDPLEGLSAVQIMAKIEATREELREWVREQHQEKGYWCNTAAVNEVLSKVDLEPLPQPKRFVVKVPTTGKASYMVTAIDADAAMKKLHRELGVDDSGTYVGRVDNAIVDLNKATVEEQQSTR